MSEVKRRKVNLGGRSTSNFLIKPLTGNASGIPAAVREFFTRYEKSKDKVFALLFETVAHVSGFAMEINPMQFNDKDLLHDLVKDIVQSYEPSTALPSALLFSNKTRTNSRPSGRYSDSPENMCKNFGNFFKRWSEQAAAIWLNGDDDFALTTAVAILTPLSAVSIRAIRQAATIALLNVITALCEYAKTLEHDITLATQQLGNLESGEAHDQLAQHKKKLRQNIEAVEALLEALFTSVFLHRYRDVVPAIRAQCMAGLGAWIICYPDKFLSNTHVRYLGWMLSDKAAPVRLAALDAMKAIYTDSERVSLLQAFSERFRERIIEIALWDSDSKCRLCGLEAIEKMAYSGLLEASDLQKLFYLLVIGSADAKLILSKLIGQFIAEEKDDLMLSMSSDTRQFAGVEALVKVHCLIETSLHEQLVLVNKETLSDIQPMATLKQIPYKSSLSARDISTQMQESQRLWALPDDSQSLCTQLFEHLSPECTCAKDWELFCEYVSAEKVNKDRCRVALQWVSATAASEEERDDAKMTKLIELSDALGNWLEADESSDIWLALFHFANQIHAHVWQKQIFEMSVKRVCDYWLLHCPDNYITMSALGKLLNEKVPSVVDKKVESMAYVANDLITKRQAENVLKFLFKIHSLLTTASGKGGFLEFEKQRNSWWEFFGNCVEMALELLQSPVERVTGTTILSLSLEAMLQFSFIELQKSPEGVASKLFHIQGICAGILQDDDSSDQFSVSLNLLCLRILCDSLVPGDSAIVSSSVIKQSSLYLCQLIRSISGCETAPLSKAKAAPLVNFSSIQLANYMRQTSLECIVGFGRLATLHRDGAIQAFAQLAGCLYSGKAQSGSAVLFFPDKVATGTYIQGANVLGQELDCIVKFVLTEIIDRQVALSLTKNKEEAQTEIVCLLIQSLISELARQSVPVSAGVALAREIAKMLKTWQLLHVERYPAIVAQLSSLFGALIQVMVDTLRDWKATSDSRTGLYVELDTANAFWKVLAPILIQLQVLLSLSKEPVEAQKWASGHDVATYIYSELEDIGLYPEATTKSWEPLFSLIKSCKV